MKIQCLSLIENYYDKLKKKFQILPIDLRHLINYKIFIQNIRKRRIDCKKIVYPFEIKFSKCYDYMYESYKNDSIDLWISYDIKHSNDHSESRWYFLTNFNNTHYQLLRQVNLSKDKFLG